jgi:ribosomal protein L37AE/L43A
MTTMAKGYECPVCGRHTVHPKSVNKLVCTTCNTLYDRAVIIDRQFRRDSPTAKPDAAGGER